MGTEAAAMAKEAENANEIIHYFAQEWAPGVVIHMQTMYCAAARRFGAQIKTSSTQRTPVKTVKRKRIKEKVISIYPLEGLLFIVLLKDGKEGFLRNLHGTDLLHSFLTGLLFFQKFTLACNVAAVALG